MSSCNAGWFAENSAITPSDGEFDKVSMTPKHVGAITEFSRNMLLQSSPDIEATDPRATSRQILARSRRAGRPSKAAARMNPTALLAESGLDITVHGRQRPGRRFSRLIETVELENSEAAAPG